MNKYTDRSRPQTTRSLVKRPQTSSAGSLSSRAATASTLFRPKLLIDNLIQTIDKPSMTNRFNLLHDNHWEKLDEFEHMKPDDSQYQVELYFPKKPLTSDICGLTLRENERLSRKSLSVSSTPIIGNDEFMINEKTHRRLPSEQDFTKILNRLEMVISNKNLGNRRMELVEGERFDDYLEIGESHYFRVSVKGKKCPMRVIIKCAKGKVKTFVSRTAIMPSEATYDQASKSYNFEVSDPGLRFRAETINLGIYAVFDSNYSIIIAFGRENEHKSTQNRYDPKDNDEAYQSEIAKIMEMDLEKHRAQYTQKKTIKGILGVSAKPLTWEIRHKQTIERKKKFLLEKRKKAEMMIIRNEIKRAEERKQREYKEAEAILQAQQKLWIVLIKFVQGLETLNERKRKERSKTLSKLKENGSARKIQMFYRKKKQNVTSNDINLLRAGPLLKLYSHNIKIIINRDVKEKLLKLIKQSARMRDIPTHFNDYYLCAVKIQKAWALYVKKKNERWSLLIELWNQGMQIYINSQVKPKSGKGKGKGNSQPKVPSIPDIQRDRILTEFIRECKRKYFKELDKFYESKGYLLNLAAGALQSQESPKRVKKEYPPSFVFSPNLDDIAKLIEKAIKLQVN
ncbi:unnamed protein product [Blepharisma stoltei]|uniref:Uncharacterized protein n=1 Tax=Blepharisma stoltei TaxID=1481888 RepID=A0AAU9JEA6_9CILI|nr:unnamed protein product [Blepharisma stoltei]